MHSVCWPPALTARTRFPAAHASDGTRVGLCWLRSSPCPNRPSSAGPHVHRKPSSQTAAEWTAPAVTSTTRRPPNSIDGTGIVGLIACGLSRSLPRPWSPRPSCPSVLAPKAKTTPQPLSIRLCVSPADTWTIFSCGRCSTRVVRMRFGRASHAVSPWPRRPLTPTPQLHTDPAESIINEWFPPATTSTGYTAAPTSSGGSSPSAKCGWCAGGGTPSSSTTTSTRLGAITFCQSCPAPSCPVWLKPHVHSAPPRGDAQSMCALPGPSVDRGRAATSSAQRTRRIRFSGAASRRPVGGSATFPTFSAISPRRLPALRAASRKLRHVHAERAMSSHFDSFIRM